VWLAVARPVEDRARRRTVLNRAICPAVLPLPYSFVLSDDAAACVSCAVSLADLTPA
jgi:hypothetical protein